MAEEDKPAQKPQRFFIGDSLNFPVFKVDTPVPSGTAPPKPETTVSSAEAAPVEKKPGTGVSGK